MTARRIDACGGCAWGMDLEFLCRRCPERPPLWTRAQRVFATMQSLAWEQCSDEGACLVTVHDVSTSQPAVAVCFSHLEHCDGKEFREVHAASAAGELS